LFLRTTIHHFHEKAQSSQDAVADSPYFSLLATWQPICSTLRSWYADVTWAEDKALRGRTLSADPAAGILRACT
jgi:hypothetical protein